MFRQSFQQTIVSNIPALLATGTTTDLAVEQVGIFDARTNQAVVLPTYSANREIYIAQGTPDFSNFPAGAGKVNETLKSKPIKGKSITGWRGKKAKRGQTSQVAIGYDGIDPTKTLKAKPDQVLNFFIKLTGSPIEKLVHGAGGWVSTIQVSMPCAADCAENCETVDCNTIVERFIKEFDKQKLPGGILLNKFVRATKTTNCATPPVLTTIPECLYCLTICDTGDSLALGSVQAQYPGVAVVRTERTGSLSTYQVVIPQVQGACAPPTAFSNADLVAIPNCAVCPSGYTHHNELFVFTVTRTDAGNGAALATLIVDYPTVDTIGVAFRLNYQFGTSTYQVYSSSDTLAPVTAGDVVTAQGSQRDVCVLTTPSTTAWSACGTAVKAVTTATITLKDSVCGTSFLTELQAIYGAVTETAHNTDTCVRTYSVPVVSDNYDLVGDCEDSFYKFTVPASFNGINWVLAPLPSGTGCVCGILLEAAFVNRTLTECYFDAFPYEFDNIHIEVATGDPNFQDYQDLCDTDTPVTKIRDFEYPAGSGQYIAALESLSREYDQLEGRPVDQFVRNAREWTFNTVLSRFYDQYVLEFGFDYFVGGFTDKYTDRYHLNVYFPEGEGGAFQTAINGYITSAVIDLPLVIL